MGGGPSGSSPGPVTPVRRLGVLLSDMGGGPSDSSPGPVTPECADCGCLVVYVSLGVAADFLGSAAISPNAQNWCLAGVCI